MAATTSATQSATSSAVDWLTVDTTGQIGPAVYGDPNEANPAPKVPTAPQQYIPADEDYSPAGEDVMYEGDGSGPWTSLPHGGLVPQAPVERPVGAERQGSRATANPKTDGSGFYDNQNSYALSDQVYQQTDTEGWEVNAPYAGRTSTRNLYGQLNPDNNPTWYDYTENPVQSKLAVTATDISSDQGVDGAYGIANGDLPPWGSLADSGGNTAYVTPGPPATSTPQASGSIFGEGGWN
jgi:hypothetical protein